ncbi:MAG: uroporphyrinogen-III synthase [Hyphomicrobiales bacterium]|nr:uroporphyrinogen-III synthase [Hyphomicrobiales bacterium]
MRVLVLRPEAVGARTARALARRGHKALLAPLLEIAPVRDGSLPAARRRQTHGAVIAASPHALALLDAETRVRIAGLLALVVGTRTAHAARKVGLRTPGRAYRTAGELAASLAERAPRGRLLYLAGRDRRPEIERALRREGRSFDLVEVYAATILPAFPPEAAKALRRGEVDAVLHYSARSASAYVALAKAKRLLQRALAPRQLCLSQAVAAPLVEVGASRVEVAGAPSEASLLRLLADPIGLSRRPA